MTPAHQIQEHMRRRRGEGHDDVLDPVLPGRPRPRSQLAPRTGGKLSPSWFGSGSLSRKPTGTSPACGSCSSRLSDQSADLSGADDQRSAAQSRVSRARGGAVVERCPARARARAAEKSQYRVTCCARSASGVNERPRATQRVRIAATAVVVTILRTDIEELLRGRCASSIARRRSRSSVQDGEADEERAPVAPAGPRPPTPRPRPPERPPTSEMAVRNDVGCRGRNAAATVCAALRPSRGRRSLAAPLFPLAERPPFLACSSGGRLRPSRLHSLLHVDAATSRRAANGESILDPLLRTGRARPAREAVTRAPVSRDGR